MDVASCRQQRNRNKTCSPADNPNKPRARNRQSPSFYERANYGEQRSYQKRWQKTVLKNRISESLRIPEAEMLDQGVKNNATDGQ